MILHFFSNNAPEYKHSAISFIFSILIPPFSLSHILVTATKKMSDWICQKMSFTKLFWKVHFQNIIHRIISRIKLFSHIGKCRAFFLFVSMILNSSFFKYLCYIRRKFSNIIKFNHPYIVEFSTSFSQ